MTKCEQNRRQYLKRKTGYAHLRNLPQIPADAIDELHRSGALTAEQESRADAAIAEACRVLRELRPVKPEPHVEVLQYNTALSCKVLFNVA